jgi:VWFA-related protein
MKFDCRTGHFRVRRHTAAASLMILAVTAQIVSAQTPTLKTRTKEDREREFQASHRITLNVQVTDAAGKPVTDLDARDFTILDNHQSRKLAAFHAIDGQAMNDATEIVIVLDTVNSTKQALEAERNGIFKFLAQTHGPLPYTTSFVLLANGHLKATGPTTDRNALGRAFVNITKNLRSEACAPVDASLAQAVAGGGVGAVGSSNIGNRAVGVATCLEQHFKDSISALDGIAQKQLTLGGRTILVWVGPGWPLLSDVEFQQLSPKARKGFFAETVSVLHDLRAAQVTVDQVGPRDATRDSEIARVNLHQLTSGTALPENAGPGSLALQVLAEQTGGRVMATSNDVAGDLGKIIGDADWYYAMSFGAPPAQNGVELHSLEVKVSRPDLHVRTMTAYYTEP